LTSVRLFVPGRLEVFGKHTDYAGGDSLVAAVPRGITLRASPGSDGRVRVRDLRVDEQVDFSASGEGPVDGWHRYPHTVIRRLASNFPDANLSARITLSSNLPQAAGISSSSALIVGIAEALIACAGIEGLDAWRDVIRTSEDRASYFGCIENGASFGPLAGDAGVGTHGGSEDHAAIVMSQSGELRQFSYSPLRLMRVVTMPPELTFVIASSGIAAPKGGAVQTAYNRLSHAAASIVSRWRADHPADTRSLGELVKNGESGRLILSTELRQRLDHFVAENARVSVAADAFARGDVAAIGELADASQSDADRLLGSQIPQTGDLASLATSLGAAAASSFGAGWGGSVWALVPTADGTRFLEQWLRAYRHRYPELSADGFVSPPSDGVRRLEASDH
jgi:galactokinase